MTSPSADESKSEDEKVEARIVELQEEIVSFNLELAKAAAAEKEFRAQEDSKKRIYFASEIFNLQQDQLRLKVEIDIVKKKIRRLRLGYLEDATPLQSGSPSGLMF